MCAVMASEHAGMGAIVYEGGVAFRVWAPNASAVAVAGDFNQWSKEAHPLFAEVGGYWSADVGGAKAADEYKFVIQGPAGWLWKKDPYGRDVDHSNGNSIVVDPAYAWRETGFSMPPWRKVTGGPVRPPRTPAAAE